MKELFNKADDFTRREMVKGMAGAFLGLNIIPTRAQAQATKSLPGAGKAKSVIYIKVTGGLSHVDSFDIKEKNKDALKASGALKTSADGIRVSKHFPKIAKHMDKVALINSMFNTQGAHRPAQYLMTTGYEQRGTVIHPHFGAWVNKLGKNKSIDIPSFVKVGGRGALGGGFFGSMYSALPVADPKIGLKDIKKPSSVSADTFDKRLALMDELNREIEKKVKNTTTDSYQHVYKDAVKLMNSKDLDAFNINKESAKLQETYGKNNFGQSCLLARRLVEKGVRFIEVTHGDWDHHFGIYDEFADNAVNLDQGVAALMSDLSSRGLLDSTLVVFATEFGRSSSLNSRDGRNHHPIAYSCWLSGAGIKGGQVYGKTDDQGERIVENKVKVPDFNATIAYAMGLPLNHVEHSPEGRPFKISDKGKPLTMLF